MLTPQNASMATELILRNGYHGASVRMLATALGTTQRGFYEVFGEKKAFVLELLKREEALLEELKPGHAASSGPPLPGPAREDDNNSRSPLSELKSWLENLERSLIQGGPPRGLLCVNLPLQLGEVEDDLRREAARVHDRMIKWIAGLLAGVDRGGSRPGDREVAEFILAGIVGSVLLGVADRDSWELSNGLARLREYIDSLA